MTRLTYKEYFGIATILAVIAIISVIWQKPEIVKGSVQVGNAYQSTTTPKVADLANLCPPASGMTRATGVLGSIVLTGQNVGTIHLYDATTTDTDAIGGNAVRAATSTLLLAEIPAWVLGNATSSATTYTLDVEFYDGLLIDKVGSAPTTTITYRCNG